MSKLSMKTYYDKSLESSPKGLGVKSRADLNNAAITAEAAMIEGVAPHCYTQILKDFIQDPDLNDLTQDIRDQLAFLSMNSAKQKEAQRMIMMDQDPGDVRGFDQEDKDMHYIQMLRYFNDMVLSYKKRDLVKNTALCTYVLGAALERRNQQGLSALEILMREGLMSEEEYNMVNQNMNSGIPLIHSGYHMAAFIDEYEGITKVLASKYLQASHAISMQDQLKEMADDILNILYNAEDKMDAEEKIVELLNRSPLLPEDYTPRMRVQDAVIDTAKVNAWSVPGGTVATKGSWAHKKPVMNYQQYDGKDNLIDTFHFDENGRMPAGTSMIVDPRSGSYTGTVIHDPKRYNESRGNTGGAEFRNTESNVVGPTSNNIHNQYKVGELYVPKVDNTYGDNLIPREDKDKFYDSLKAAYPNDQVLYYTEDQCPYETSHREYDIVTGEVFVVGHKKELGGKKRIYWSRPKLRGTTAMSPKLREELGYDPTRYEAQYHFSNSGVDKRTFDFNHHPRGDEPRSVQFSNGDRGVYIDGQGWAVRKYENQARSKTPIVDPVFNEKPKVTTDRDLRKNPFKRGELNTTPAVNQNRNPLYNADLRREEPQRNTGNNMLLEAQELRGYSGRNKYDDNKAEYPYVFTVIDEKNIEDRMICVFEGIYWSDRFKRYMTGEYYQFIDQDKVQDFVERHRLSFDVRPVNPVRQLGPNTQSGGFYNQSQGADNRRFSDYQEGGYNNTGRSNEIRVNTGEPTFRRGNLNADNTISKSLLDFANGTYQDERNSYQRNQYNQGGYERDVWTYVGQAYDSYGNLMDVERNQYGEERLVIPRNTNYNQGGNQNNNLPRNQGNRKIITY